MDKENLLNKILSETGARSFCLSKSSYDERLAYVSMIISLAWADGSIDSRERDIIDTVAKAAGPDIGIECRAFQKPQLPANAGHGEEHAAAFASAMLEPMPLVRRSVGDMTVTDHLVVRQPVHRLKLLHEVSDRAKLDDAHRLVVVSDAFDADREVVHVLLAVPHRASRMEGHLVAVDDTVDRSVFGHAEMTLSAIGDLLERTLRRSFGGMKDDELGRGAHTALGIARTPIAVRSVDRVRRRDGQQDRKNRYDFPGHWNCASISGNELFIESLKGSSTINGRSIR